MMIHISILPHIIHLSYRDIYTRAVLSGYFGQAMIQPQVCWREETKDDRCSKMLLLSTAPSKNTSSKDELDSQTSNSTVTRTKECIRRRKRTRIWSSGISGNNKTHSDASLSLQLSQSQIFSTEFSKFSSLSQPKGTFLKRHFGVHELEPFRLIGDTEMDVIFEFRSKAQTNGKYRLDDIIQDLRTAHECTKKISPSSRIVETANDINFDMHVELYLARFYDKYMYSTPHWVDWTQLQRGMDVLITYFPVAGMSLFYRLAVLIG